MEMILGHLSDAQKKFITQDAVKSWLRELVALAFDADNVLDELRYHRLHKEVKKMMATKAKDKVLSFFSSFNGISRRLNMAHTIKQINADFKSMNQRAKDLGLQDIIRKAPAAVANTSTETDSLSLDQIFVGRDDDVPKLVHMLTHTHPQEEKRMFSIVALVGMGGMGKTTLARKVFNHGSVKARFGSPIWVHVSQTFDPISLFKKILSALSSDIGHGVEREQIVKRLQEALKNKTYLLVLDDVWNEDISKWEDFIKSIIGATSTKGNGIIITTRSEKVASTVGPIHVHHLNGLSDEDCWSIIKAKTLVGNGEFQSGFEMIGRKIAKRCQGLPLAANVVGGVHCGKSEEDWRIINEKWLSDAEGGQNICEILKLSYDHLSSPSLKKCFTFCSVFPKGRKIEKHELIELWMAEGFLQPSRRDDMESVGNMFFSVLLQNSLLQVAEKNDYGNVSECVMHDLVHDVASSVLSNNADDSTPARYMFLKKESSPIPKNVAKHLRTLFLEGGTSCTKFSGFECLHNLTLSGDYEEIPDSVRGLVHLRNLNISNTKIVKLPKWIGELHLLQTLRVNIWRLEKLPSTLKYMFNLRHLHIYSDTKFPAEIGKLTSLQTLPYFTVGKEKGYHIEELGSLENLKGMLKIGNLEMVCDKEDALKANISQKPNLFHLAFRWSDYREDEINDESVLEGLQPHENLKKLKISRFRGKRFPAWTEKMEVRDGPRGSWVPLANLIEIKLSECSKIEEIPSLEHLPNLKSLSLYSLRKVRLINTSFNHLTSLKIEELDILEYLPERIFYNNQNLSCLEICNCGVLRELPDGLDTLNSLEILRIWYCENLKSIGNPSGGARQSQGILRELRITECGELMELPCQMLEPWAPTVEDLELEALGGLKNLPRLIDSLAKSSTRLAILTIIGVPKLMAASIGSVESWDLSSLRRLEIDVSVEWSREDSVGIAETVEGMLQRCCNSLTRLQLKGVENWEWLPQSIQYLTSVSVLSLEKIGVEELPQWLGNLSSLTRLFLRNCNKLMSLPSVDALKHLIINVNQSHLGCESKRKFTYVDRTTPVFELERRRDIENGCRRHTFVGLSSLEIYHSRGIYQKTEMPFQLQIERPQGSK
ncbi:disease resistance protein RGA2-like [Salvia splendens]|nr:disease resistance protein RGA2-like [Salvia splendens]